MSTATLQQPETYVVGRRHYQVTNQHTWVCYQVNCDGLHHYWRCAH